MEWSQVMKTCDMCRKIILDDQERENFNKLNKDYRFHIYGTFYMDGGYRELDLCINCQQEVGKKIFMYKRLKDNGEI